MRSFELPVLLMAFTLALPALAQTPPAPAAAPPQPGAPMTLHAAAKLVVVDVVVMDRDHHPVHGLMPHDFTLQESGQPQTINHFEEHKALTAADVARFQPLPSMPPGVFSNYVPTPTNAAVNIVLLDALNTPLQDQQYVRQQLLDYLKNARPGTNVAIFGLSTRLVMLQGFTSNPEILKSVVRKAAGGTSPLLDDAVSGGGAAPTDSAADQNDAMGGLMPAQVVANMQTFMDITQSFQLMLRAKYTLDAMNVLARYLSAIPGRKNLIWFSGSFPLDIMPDMDNNPSDPFAGVADSEAEYRETTNLLARSQVAVYPVDARGLMTSPVFNASNSGAKYARNPSAMTRDQNKFFSSTTAEHATMQRMADDTGGHAFVNTNGLAQAVDHAIEEGSNYYTLMYTPTNTKWRGDYRKIEIKLEKSGYQLEYRRGYFADDPDSASSAVNTADAATPTQGPGGVNRDPALILKVMAHGVPGATEILYKVRVVPTSAATEDTPAAGNQPTEKVAKPPYRRFSVDYAVLPTDFTYTLTPDGLRHAYLEFVTLVYQQDGQIINRIVTPLETTMTEQQFARVRQTGFPLRQEISVPVKGDFYLRLGVHDLKSNHIGAMEIPVNSVKNLPPIPPPSAPKPAAPAPAPAPPPQ